MNYIHPVSGCNTSKVIPVSEKCYYIFSKNRTSAMLPFFSALHVHAWFHIVHLCNQIVMIFWQINPLKQIDIPLRTYHALSAKITSSLDGGKGDEVL